MAGEHRDSHARSTDRKIGNRQNLACLVAQLGFFVSLPRTIVKEAARLRHNVESDRRDVLVRRRELHGIARIGEFLDAASGHRVHLRGKLLHTRQPASRHRLIRRSDHPAQPSIVVQRLENRHRRHGGAVRVRDDSLPRCLDGTGINLADDQRYLGIHPPGGGVVDHDRAGLSEGRRPLLGRGATGG